MYEHVQKIPIAMILYVYTSISNKCTRTCLKICHETNTYMYVFIKHESVRLAMNYTGYMYGKKKGKNRCFVYTYVLWVGIGLRVVRRNLK